MSNSEAMHRFNRCILKAWTGKQVGKRPHQTGHKAWFSHILFCYFRGSTLRQPWFFRESGNSTMTNRCFLLWLKSNPSFFNLNYIFFMNKEYYLHISVISISYPKYTMYDLFTYICV